MTAEWTSAVDIRDLETDGEYTACVALQREVWGADFQECVPPALLMVTQKIGGIAAGAFDGEELVGFVYGMTGWLEGALLHWSHMLAVAPRSRGAGIGRRLKEYQRNEVKRKGAQAMAWSFDPLVARNAHLNLNVLGATVWEYVESMYVPTASDLHGSLPVDRFVVRWQLDGEPPGADGATPGSVAGTGAAPVVTLDWQENDDGSRTSVPDAPEIRILVPRDFELLLQVSEGTAAEARARTRAFFQAYLGDGWKVVGFERPADRDPYYVLRRDEH